MNPHLNDAILEGYVLHTLTDAERESVDQHLADCPTCRHRAADHNTTHRGLEHELARVLNRARPRRNLTFADASTRFTRARSVGGWHALGRAATNLAIVAFVVLGMWLVLRVAPLTASTAPLAASPDQPYEHLTDVTVFLPIAGNQSLAPGWIAESGIDELTGAAAYNTGFDTEHTYNGRSTAFIRNNESLLTSKTGGPGKLSYRFPAVVFRGYHVRFDAYIRTEGVANWAAPWVQVRGKSSVLSHQGLQTVRLHGDNDWQPISVTFAVPLDAEHITVGIMLNGVGQVSVSKTELTFLQPISP